MAKTVAAAGPVEGPWALPDGWRWQRLGAVATSVGGGRFKLNKSHYVDEGFPAFSAAGQDGFVERWEFEGEAVVLSSIGARCGKSFYAYGRWTSLANTQCIMPEAELDARYLWYFTNNEERWERSGSAQPFIKPATIKALSIPLPPINEQRRIVARIDELFAEIDDGEAALARARDDLATWRKALLKAAVTGELTADWRAANPATETGADLLACILAGRRDRWEADAKNRDKRYVEPVGSADADLPSLPEGWAWSSMGQLLDRIEAGLNVKCVERPPHGSETGLLKISAVTWWRFNERASKTLADSHVHPDQWLIADGDLLVSRANTLELVGAPAIVEGLSLRLMLSDKVLRLAMPAHLRRWTFYVMRSPYGRAWIESRATGNQLSMRNISQDTLRAMPIPLPSRMELEHIVQLLNAASSEHETTANGIGTFDVAAATLRQSVLAAAFRGELA